MDITAQTIWSDIMTIREKTPLIHNITNYVVMNNTANALLALGASPVMAHAVEEVTDMVGLAGALVVNIGTLSEPWIKAMEKALIKAKEIGVPIVLDPVGAGATPYRTKTLLNLLSLVDPTVIRGNASEILAITGAETRTKGVDSVASSGSALDAARRLSGAHRCSVCVSGEQDLIVEGDHIVTIHNGHPMMPRVTGLGCTASALCGAFLAVNTSSLAAASHAMAVMGIAGEIAGEEVHGPGSFQVRFLDALYTLSEPDINARVRIENRS
jgi:hydroxyethylthiazole kinase